jgi:hypothetical protein
MKKFFGYLAWLYILLATALNLAAFLAIPGYLDRAHWLIVLCGAFAAAGFVVERFFHRGGDRKKTNYAYKQILDYERECEFCREPMILLTDGDTASPTFHTCTCQYPRPHIIQDGIGEIPSFARANF